VLDELYGKCSNCGYVGINIKKQKICPNCKTNFKYAAFRNKKNQLWDKLRLLKDDFVIIDYDDYNFWINKQKAYDIFK